MKLKNRNYTFVDNVYYLLDVIKYYLLFLLEFLHLKNPFNNKYVKPEDLPYYVNEWSFKHIITHARYRLFREHLRTRQRYGNRKTYFFHLNMVASHAAKYYQEPFNDNPFRLHFLDIYIIALGHDMIEDIRYTYHDVKKMYGKNVAEGIFACTELRGKNRAERHGDEYIKTLQKNPDGLYVKLCDIYSNMYACKTTGHVMLKKYTKEWSELRDKLSHDDYQDTIIKAIDELIK